MIHVIGASGRSGAALCRALLARGTPYTPVIRDLARWAATALPGTPRLADLADPPALAAALGAATAIASCAHARHTRAILAASPPAARFALLGSTRKFTRWPDAHAQGVLAGEAAFLASGRQGAMLHPTMIYGAEGEDNVRRLARLLRLPILPLPGGGQNLVQPIHQSDVTRALLATLDRGWTGPQTLVIAGPTPLPYHALLAAIAHATHRPPPRIVPLPLSLLRTLTPLTLLPLLPRIRPPELRRLLEDKAFDIAPMQAKLGLTPIPLDQGLALTFP